MALAGLLDLPNYHVKAGSVDARGWPLFDAKGVYVGQVEDYVVDTEAMEARYIVVALEGLFREVVLPIGSVDFDDMHCRVICREALRAQIENLPYIGGTRLSLEEERNLYATFIPGTEEVVYDRREFRPRGVVFLAVERKK